MECQLQVLAEAGRELSLPERLGRRVRKLPAYLKMRIDQLVSNAGRAPTTHQQPASPPAREVVLGRQPGERVRIKSAKAIRRSLDEQERGDRANQNSSRNRVRL